MPERISNTEGGILPITDHVMLLITDHQVTRKMICCIMCRVRRAHTVNEYNAAHPYRTVKSPGFDKKKENRYGMGFVFCVVEVRSDKATMLPVTMLIRATRLDLIYTLTTPWPLLA